MPFWLVKFSVSPARKPVPIVTVAPVELPPLSASLTVKAAVERHRAPPPVKVAVRAGRHDRRDVHRVERAGRRRAEPLLARRR